MNLKLIFLIPILVFISFGDVKAQEDLLNYQNSIKYASHLFDNGLYDLSAIEYERIVFLQPNDTLAKLRLVQSYRLMNDLKKAKLRLDSFFPCCSDYCNKDFSIENFKILFQGKRYDECNQFLRSNHTLELSTCTEFKTATLLMQYKWEEAKETSNNYLLTNPADVRLNKLYHLSETGATIKYKNPYAAAAFSGIIPGSGKFYAGQWKDGLYAFLAVTAFSYLTYRSFDKNGLNPYGFIFGSVSFAFYTANIFGSYKSAVRYNRRRNEDTVRDVDKLIME